MTRLLFAFVTMIPMLVVPAARAENWPRFRGPNGDGISASKQIPVQWTERDGLLWKTTLPGVGHSSPVIWGDRLFLQSASVTERMLICLRVSDGKELLKPKQAGTKAHIHDKNSCASATTTNYCNRVY